MATSTQALDIEQRDRGRSGSHSEAFPHSPSKGSRGEPPSDPSAPAEVQGSDTTFGIELEFLSLEHMPRGRKKPAASLQTVEELLVDALRTRYHGHCVLPDCKQYHTHFLPVHDAGRKRPYTKWGVHSDPSVRTDTQEHSKMSRREQDEFAENGMEVTSRALPFECSPPHFDPATWDPASHTPFWDSFWEIQLVLRRLYNVSKSSDLKLLANFHCGLHVHVGNGSERFTAAATRNILSIVTVFERLWDSIHSARRITGAGNGRFAVAARRRARRYSMYRSFRGNDDCEWARPYSYNALAKAYYARREEDFEARNPGGDDLERRDWQTSWPQSKLDEDPGLRASCQGMSALSWHHIFQSATTLDQLTGLHTAAGATTSSKRSTVCLDHMTTDEEYAARPPRENSRLPSLRASFSDYEQIETIEFRQHAGSLNFEEIRSWVCAVVAMVQFSQRSSVEDMNKLVLPNWCDLNMTFPQLLEHLQAKKVAVDFYKNKLRREVDYSVWLQAETMRPFDNLSPGDSFYNTLEIIARFASEPHAQHMKFDAVREKLRTGGYGQFPFKALRAVRNPPLRPEDIQRVTSFFREEGSGDLSDSVHESMQLREAPTRSASSSRKPERSSFHGSPGDDIFSIEFDEDAFAPSVRRSTIKSSSSSSGSSNIYTRPVLQPTTYESREVPSSLSPWPPEVFTPKTGARTETPLTAHPRKLFRPKDQTLVALETDEAPPTAASDAKLARAGSKREEKE